MRENITTERLIQDLRNDNDWEGQYQAAIELRYHPYHSDAVSALYSESYKKAEDKDGQRLIKAVIGTLSVMVNPEKVMEAFMRSVHNMNNTAEKRGIASRNIEILKEAIVRRGSLRTSIQEEARKAVEQAKGAPFRKERPQRPTPIKYYTPKVF